MVLCFELLERWGDDEIEAEATEEMDRCSDKERLSIHLFRSAEMMHRAVTLPDSALPKKMRGSFEEWLTMISDELHKATPEQMDASKYHEGRTAYIESLRAMKDEEMRKIWIASYDQRIETVKMLAKYRSAPKKGGKTKKDGKE